MPEGPLFDNTIRVVELAAGCLVAAWFEGDVGIGDLVQVELVEAGPNSLAGRLRERVAA